MRQQFIRETELGASADKVFNWHTSLDAFTLLIPPWEAVRLIELTGSIATEGSLAILEMKLLNCIPLRWVARHQNYQAGESFQDVQIQGPFRYWCHTHRVIPLSGETCLLRDSIEYELPLGFLGTFVASGFVRHKLTRLFNYRHQVMSSLFARS
jgi:uncharacterized protein